MHTMLKGASAPAYGPEALPPSVGVKLRTLKRSDRWADKLFRWAMLACGSAILGLVGLVAFELVHSSMPSLHQFGWKFFFTSDWDPVNSGFGALPFLFGTAMTCIVALIIAVPLAVGQAVFITEISPGWLRMPVGFAAELLAAIPSVIYGFWGIFVLVPLMRQYVEPWAMKYLSWTGWFEGPPYGIGLLTAGIVLSIMIIPIISSITREVISAVPRPQREAVLALGATRWEMIRIAVLRNARAGILGSVILGLGRAIGETMAVTMVIGNVPQIAHSLLAPGDTMASVIANQFNEAVGNIYRSSIIEVGLALFIITILVNIAAGLLVWSVTRGVPTRANA